MELMDNSSTIGDTIIPKLIEFPEHFILNSQLYDKQTLKPIPMKFYTNIALKNPFITLQTSIDKTNYFCSQYLTYIQNNNEENRQNIIQDKNNSNIFYIIQKYDGNYDVQYLYKIQYNSITKKYTILNTFSSTNSIRGGAGDIRILGETNEYFILFITTNNGTYSDRYEYYCNDIRLINKNNFEHISVYSNGDTSGIQYHLININNDCLYALVHANYYTRRIIKINISSKSNNVMWTETPTATVGIRCNIVNINDNYYTLASYLENGIYSYKMTKIVLNTTNDTVNTELLDINLNGFMLDNSPATNMRYSIYVHYTLKVIKTDSATYISCLIHGVPNGETTYDYQHKHVLLKFNGTSFNVVDVVSLTDGCYGSLNFNDSKHQVWYMSNCVLFYSFDETSEKMICTYKKGGMFMQIGFDSLNRFITQTKDYTIEILTDTNACILKADFNEEVYDKNNSSDLNTTISFYAKNFLDEYLETNVKLSLIGPVIFEENNTKELIVNTSKEGISTVPVIIKGYGNIEVIITQNT